MSVGRLKGPNKTANDPRRGRGEPLTEPRRAPAPRRGARRGAETMTTFGGACYGVRGDRTGSVPSAGL